MGIYENVNKKYNKERERERETKREFIQVNKPEHSGNDVLLRPQYG